MIDWLFYRVDTTIDVEEETVDLFEVRVACYVWFCWFDKNILIMTVSE